MLPILWKTIRELSERISIPAEFHLAQLDDESVERLVSELTAWYPEMSVSSEACHLESRFYRAKTYLANRPETQERVIFPLLLMKGEEIVFYFSIQSEPTSRTITGRLFVMNPAYRGHGIGKLAPYVVEGMGRLIGSELVYYYASLSSLHIQRLAEQSGYQLVGIIPASDRILLDDGSTKRVFEAVYAKVLVEKSDCHFPRDEMLTPKTRRLMQFLFEDLEKN